MLYFIRSVVDVTFSISYVWYSISCIRVTRKHWPPDHGPPLRTGSVDYLQTGPRTTRTDPSTDHPPIKIKKKRKRKILLTACPIDHSCQRNSARYAGLRWVNVTDLGSVSSTSYVIADHLHLCHFRCCNFAWKTGKPKKFVISFPSPFCVFISNSAWQIVKTGTSSRTRGRIGRTKLRRRCTQSSTNFEASRRFLGLSYMLIATAKEKNGNVECQWYKFLPRLNSGLLHFPSVTLEISTRVIYCRRQEVSEIFISVLFFFKIKF